MLNEYEKIEKYAAYIKSKIAARPKLAVVLGSGLGDFAEELEEKTIIHYKDIPDFPVSTAPNHKGCFVFGKFQNKSIALMQGRIHYYEGYSMPEVVAPIRLLRFLGIETIILTNAAGSINPDYKPADFMLITDHISSLVPSALRGENFEQFGKRFSDMSTIYDIDLQKLILKAAAETNIELKKGVYIQTSGPNFETPAEIRMYSLWGADAVGMSTACEATAANHMGMKIAGISLISNYAAGLNAEPLSAEEVVETAEIAKEKFTELLSKIISLIGV